MSDDKRTGGSGVGSGDRHMAEPLDDAESPATPPPRMADGFGLVLVLIVLAYLIAALVSDNAYGRELTLVILATMTWTALRAAGVRGRLLHVASSIIPLAAVVAIVLALTGDDRIVGLVSGGLIGLLVVVAPAAILRRLNEHRLISLDTLFGALCVYLLIALFFATIFSFSAAVSGQPFFAQESMADARAADYLYYSLTTITTVGYGDLTAREDLGRMMSVMEAVVGQVFLISVVALVVQNLGQARHLRRRSHR